MKTFGLQSKKILVTGAEGFLGRHIVRALNNEGADVIAVDVKGDNKLDISDPLGVYNFKYKIKKDMGKIDGLINNAAISYKGNKDDPVAFLGTMNINAKGTYNCIEKFKDIISVGGSIVNIASIYGVISPDFDIYDGNEELYSSCAYGASKAAIIAMTRYYARQLSGIRVNAISPGGIFQNHSEDFVNKYSSRVPLNRMAGVDEIVNAILFFLSPLSSYITGQNLVADGGLSI